MSMIPKIIHYCWFGKKPLPELAVRCIESWRKFLPDYEIKEWNESNFNVDMIPYTAEAYRLGKYAFVSDFCRFYVLYNYGGLYFDTDVEVIKPLDDIVECGAFMGFEDYRGTTLMGINNLHVSGAESADLPEYLGVATGLGLGAEPGNEFYKEVVEFYSSAHFATMSGKFRYTVIGIVSTVFKDKTLTLGKNGIVHYKDVLSIYPCDYFCPLNAYTGELKITPNTRSIHHYTASWTFKKTIGYKILSRIKFVLVRVYCSVFLRYPNK